MTILEPVTNQSRADAVASSLIRYLAESDFAVGTRLPAERTFAERLGVSRGIVREALAQLTTLGIVESRTGSGTFLCKRPSISDQHVVMTVDAERTTLLQYLELRRALESEVASLLAKRASAEDVAYLHSLVDAIEAEHAELGTAHDADKRFHLALFERLDNPLFLQILTPLWEVLETLWNAPLGNRNVGQGTLPLHRQLVHTIAECDAEAARETVLQLLGSVENDLLEDARATGGDS